LQSWKSIGCYVLSFFGRTFTCSKMVS
jgi:hypothetical protein